MLKVENYEFALDAILDENAIEIGYSFICFCAYLNPNLKIDNLPQDKQEAVEDSAITLYGLIHARYILSGPGMHRMVRSCFRFSYCLV
jgi:hypothetical protein